MQGVALVLAAFSFIAILLAWSRWLAHRRWAAAGHVALALAAAGMAVFLWQLLESLAGYHAAVRGLPVAELYLEQTGARSYRVTLTRLPAGEVQVYELLGDQWRIELRTLAWRGAAAKLGLRPASRLERLAARYSHPPAEGDPPASSYPLSRDDGEDLWAKARTSTGWSQYVEAGLAGTPWSPLAGGARYSVRFDGGALTAVRENPAEPSKKPPVR